MKINVLVTACVCVLALCLADVASAQPGGGGRGRGGFGGGNNWLGLLRMDSIQNEIELVDDQQQEIESLQEEMWTEMRENMAGMRDLEPEERRERFAELREEMEERQVEYQEKIEKVLLPMQLKRLKELHLQSQSRRNGDGAMGVLQNEDLLEELGISEEQKKELEEKAEEVRKDLEKKIKELRAKAEKEILSVLSSEQRKKFLEKVGESFDFGNNRGGFGRDGGRQGRGRDGGREGRGRDGGREGRRGDEGRRGGRPEQDSDDT